MNPIFNEYCKFLKDKTGLELQEGMLWLDRQIIKCFDKSGKVHKLYRLCVDDNLNVTYKHPKKYESIDNIDVATWKDLVEMNIDHLIKIEAESLDLIRDKLSKYNVYIPLIPVSMGKDSVVTTHLVRNIRPDVEAIFNNTSLDCADTYLMAKQFPNCRTMNPSVGFYNYVKETKMIPTRFARFCCKKFKTGEMVNQLNHKTKYLMFLGMRNEESNTRSGYQDEWKNEAEWGSNTDWQGILPIRKWSEMDIWLYTFWRKLEINSKYKKGYSRVGCAVACPFYNKSTWVLDNYFYPLAYDRWHKILSEDFIAEGKWCTLNCTLKEYQTSWNGGMVRDEPTNEVVEEFMQYKNIKDKAIANKYFNNACSVCGKKVRKDEVALSLKYFGRDNNKMLCWKHLSEIIGKPKNELKEDVERFKMQGCSLF